MWSMMPIFMLGQQNNTPVNGSLARSYLTGAVPCGTTRLATIMAVLSGELFLALGQRQDCLAVVVGSNLGFKFFDGDF